MEESPVFPFLSSSPLLGDNNRGVDIAAMADQPDNNHSSDKGPKVEFNGIDWPDPVGISGPPANDIDDGGIDNGEGPSFRLDNITRPSPMIAPGNALDTLFGADILQAAQQVAAVESPVSLDPIQLKRASSTIGDVISEGKLRDSLDLKKYKPLSRSGSQVSPFGGGEGWKAAMDMRPFSRPATMLPRGRSSDALNVVQPYPNPYGFKRTRTAHVNLGPYRPPLLNRQPGPISVTHMLDGSVMVSSKPQSEVPQNKESKVDGGKAAKAAGRFSRSVARIMRKDKPKGNDVAPKQTGGILKQPGLAAKDKGKGKAVEFVDLAEPGSSKDIPMASGVGPLQAGAVIEPQSIMKEGKGKDKAGEVADAGQPALHKGNDAAGDPQVAATQKSRGGKKVDIALKAVRRKVRKVVGRYWKVPVLIK